MAELDKLQQCIEYQFNDKYILIQALRHRSFCNEHKMKRIDSNERMEFLGDAILQLETSQYLYRKYPNLSEGEISKKRTSMVCEKSLASCARLIHLGNYIYLGKGEEISKGYDKDSILADAMEALIGALYLDGGITVANEFIDEHIINRAEVNEFFFDSKTALQERVRQITADTLRYRVVSISGPEHLKTYNVVVSIGDRDIGAGSGTSKKSAEQSAAMEALSKL